MDEIFLSDEGEVEEAKNKTSHVSLDFLFEFYFTSYHLRGDR